MVACREPYLFLVCMFDVDGGWGAARWPGESSLACTGVGFLFGTTQGQMHAEALHCCSRPPWFMAVRP